jgi:hypothetical protein
MRSESGGQRLILETDRPHSWLLFLKSRLRRTLVGSMPHPRGNLYCTLVLVLPRHDGIASLLWWAVDLRSESQGIEKTKVEWSVTLQALAYRALFGFDPLSPKYKIYR